MLNLVNFTTLQVKNTTSRFMDDQCEETWVPNDLFYATCVQRLERRRGIYSFEILGPVVQN